jgi:hypothetical protein
MRFKNKNRDRSRLSKSAQRAMQVWRVLEEAGSKGASMRRLCRLFGVSPTTARRYIETCKAAGLPVWNRNDRWGVSSNLRRACTKPGVAVGKPYRARGRCGARMGELVCERPKNHQGEHMFTARMCWDGSRVWAQQEERRVELPLIVEGAG